MGRLTTIGWCDCSWSPWWGCIKVSPGCEHCYADTLSSRWGHNVFGPAKTTQRRLFGPGHWAEPLKWNKEALAEGRHWRVFPSMCDPFEDNPQLVADRIQFWALISTTPNLDWLLLTKRPENILRMIPSAWRESPPANVWYGTSVESQEYDWRVDELRKVPAIVRFISYEPALGPVRWLDNLDGIQWIIPGGESGAGARPFNTLWASHAIIAGAFNGVSVYIKQLGTNPIDATGRKIKLKAYKGDDPKEWPEIFRIQQFPIGSPTLVPL